MVDRLIYVYCIEYVNILANEFCQDGFGIFGGTGTNKFTDVNLTDLL